MEPVQAVVWNLPARTMDRLHQQHKREGQICATTDVDTCRYRIVGRGWILGVKQRGRGAMNLYDFSPDFQVPNS